MNGSAMVLVRVGCLGAILWASVAFAGEPAAREPRITIDAAKTGAPISKYIYGQFIEHLGRCIYGGIWAEMLEDRKFFYPVGANESPWTAEGGKVTMAKDDSFVGEHTPLLAPGTVLRQAGLGLVEGKKYVGYIWTKPAGKETDIEVGLRWGDKDMGMWIRNDSGAYQKTMFAFTAGATTDNGVLEIKVTDKSPCLVGTVSLMPADNVQGMRADTLAVLKELAAPVYRWPGGNFVSGYNWRDGIGDRDRRPPRKNPAWKGVEHNDFGLDEFMAFCRLLGAEPYIAVNSGLGDAQSAVEELQYANGGADTPMGKLRAANGHAEPYGVKWWGIGNEMYGNWQLGHMPIEEYVRKHNQFAEAMRAVDPSIRLVAVGEAGKWSEAMMRQCADHMDLVSEHFYVGEKPDLAAHVRQVPDQIRGKADAHRRYRRELESLQGKDIRIAMDEWNYWYGPHLYGEIGTRYFLKDALGIAAGIHEYARQSDIVFMANYAQTVNVIGCIKTTKTAAAFDTTGLVLALYRKHFGTLPVAATATAPLDAAAAFSEDRKTLTLAVVNASLEKADVALEIQGAQLTGAGRRWEITGPGPDAFNEPGKPPSVTVSESAVRGLTNRISVAPASVTLLALEVK